MGTWGTGTFENDDASDWVYELETAESPEILAATLKAVTSADSYLEAPSCVNALAAAEVVAGLAGKPAADLPEAVTKWLHGRPQTDASRLKPLALAAIDRILTDSELKDLWSETDDLETWQRAVRDVRTRLSAA